MRTHLHPPPPRKGRLRGPTPGGCGERRRRLPALAPVPVLVLALLVLGPSCKGKEAARRGGPGPDAGPRVLGGPEAAARRLAWALARSAELATRWRTPRGDRLVLGQVERGSRLIPLLSSHGLRRTDIFGVMSALKGKVNFARIRPGQRFEAHLEEASGQLRYFRYVVSLEEAYEVERKGSALEGRRQPIAVTWREMALGGTVVSSIAESLAEQGAHATLAYRMGEVLSRQVGFFKGQRPGDTFRVILKEGRVEGQFLRYGPVLALEYTGARTPRKRFVRFEPKEGEPTLYDERGISLPRTVLHIPVHYTRITSPFGMRFHPVLKRKAHHAGVDFAAPTGTSVRACLEGKVLFAGRRGAYGNLVILDHGGGLHSYYGHLSAFAPGLRVGQTVKRKRRIGLVGSTGRSTGPHLHFGLQRYGAFIDPLAYRIQPGGPAPVRVRAAVQALLRARTAALERVPIFPPSRLLTPISDTAGPQGIE